MVTQIDTGMAEIYRKKIHDANLISDKEKRVMAHSKIGRELCIAGNLNRAIRDAKNLGMTTQDISRVLMQNGFVTKARLVAASIPNRIEREEVVLDMIRVAKMIGDRETRIQVIRKLSAPFPDSRRIVNDMIEADDIDGAIEFANAILVEMDRVGALRQIVRAQIKANDIDGATTTAKMIPKKVHMRRAFEEIFKASVMAGDHVKATETEKMIAEIQRQICAI